MNQDVAQKIITELLMNIVHGNSEDVRSSQEKIMELEKQPGFALHLLVIIYTFLNFNAFLYMN